MKPLYRSIADIPKPKGGARLGSGPKPIYGTPMRRHQVMCTDEQWAHFQHIGGPTWFRREVEREYK